MSEEIPKGRKYYFMGSYGEWKPSAKEIFKCCWETNSEVEELCDFGDFPYGDTVRLFYMHDGKSSVGVLWKVEI